MIGSQVNGKEETVDVLYLRKYQSTIVQYQAVLDDCKIIN